MAKAKRSKSRRGGSTKTVRGPKMCECESTKIRKEFSKASSCSMKARALDKLKQAAAADADHLKPGAKRLLFRELLQKQQKVQDCFASQEASDSSRFNGLGRMRRRGPARRRRSR